MKTDMIQSDYKTHDPEWVSPECPDISLICHLYEFQEGFDNENYPFEPTLAILARHLLEEVGWVECDSARGCE
jgi:hypothetical protein